MDQSTLNTDQESSPDTSDAPEEFISDGEMTSTVETRPVPSEDAEQNTSDDAGKGEEESKEEDKGEAKAKDTDRFDQHPRFQELIREKNELKNELAEIRESLKSRGEKEADPGVEDIAALDNDTIREQFDEDPKGFLAQFARQIAHEVESKVVGEVEAKTQAEREAQAQESIARTFESYAAKNPDFNDMWDSGELKAYMDKHPGHNAISAHQVLTAEARIEAAKAEAAKEAEAKFQRNLKTKGKAAVISESTAPRKTLVDAELKNPKKFGGVNAVLARRLAERRAAGG